jgi:hypothetical protein|tara:strand:- start:12633 stop:13418 length:786 start_codon:yes stop_codon:yes gene_type:complete
MSEDTNAAPSTTTLCFPEKLRSNAEAGYAHVQFNINTETALEAKSIHLFVPQGFAVPDSASYGSIDLGMIGTAAAVGEGGTITEADATAATTKGIASAVGLEGVNAAANLDAGIAINPYTNVAFTNTTVRSFSFAFKLISESKAESHTAAIIENVFRKYLYPKKAGVGTLEYPPTFEITFYSGEEKNKFMPKILTSYLTNLTTTYNSTTNAYHDDGQPVEIDMSLTFQETRALTRGDLYDNDNTLDNDIGYLGGKTIRGMD